MVLCRPCNSLAQERPRPTFRLLAVQPSHRALTSARAELKPSALLKGCSADLSEARRRSSEDIAVQRLGYLATMTGVCILSGAKGG